MPTVPAPVVVAGPTSPTSVSPWRIAVALGPSFVGFSGRDISAPVLFGLQLGGSYEFLRGPSELRAGVTGLYAALPYTKVTSDTQQTSSFWGSAPHRRLFLSVIDPLSLGAGIGLGIVWWAGLAGQPLHARRR